MTSTKTNELGVEIVEYSVKETAAEVRKALRAAFPGVKFSVTMARGTAYGWMDCSWTDGPTADQVRPILAGFESSRFDGMDDAYHSVEPTMYAREDGTLWEPRYSSCGINWQRSYTAEATAWAKATATPGTIWFDRGEQRWGDGAYYGPMSLLAETDFTADPSPLMD